MKKLFIIFLLINLFSCSNTKSTWDCPILGAGNGNCRSIKKADLNHQIIENKNEFFQLPAKINIKLIAPKFEDVKKLQIENKEEKNNAKSNLRTEEKIGRVWFAPFIDSEGNQHSQKTIYVVDEEAKWIGQND